MRTVISSPLRLSVGQLANSGKTDLKPLSKTKKTVGRQQTKTSHTPARPPQACEAGVYTLDFQYEKLFKLSDLDLNTYLTSILTDFHFQLHNHSYTLQIRCCYKPLQADLFLRLVRLFALQRKTDNLPVVITTEDDFLKTIRLLKQRKIYHLEKHIRTHQKAKVLQLIEDRFSGRYFEEELLCEHLYLTIQKVQHILRLLCLENVLERGSYGYRLLTKPFSHVII